jgi:hypothetical protein
MIARCHTCGDVLSVTYRNGGVGEYQCRSGHHVRCNQGELDTIGETAILEYLARPQVYEKLTAGEDKSDAELSRVRAELSDVSRELDALRARVGAGTLSVDSLVIAEPVMQARLSALQEQEHVLATPSALRDLITLGEDVADRWKDIPLSARRTIARRVLVPELLGELRVERRDRGYPQNRHQPVSERIRWART